MLHRHRYTLVALAVAILLVTSCAPQIVTVTVMTPPETVTVVVTATPSPSPPPPSPEPKSLTICVVGEPDTLYLYGGSRLAATQHVAEALYDGPIDHRDFAYQPVILQRLPSVANGDVTTRTVRVRDGYRVVDATGEVVELTEGTLIRPPGCYANDCAVEYEGGFIDMEKMMVTFTLREDVTWADGEPLTTEDSTFAFEVASDPATPGRRDLVERTSSYYITDDWQVRWTGLPGFTPADYFLNFFAPLPRHQLEESTPTELIYADETRRSPLGWGPFVVEEWELGDHITLTRNPYYFRASEGLPHLERIVFRFTTGAADLTARLLTGECDVGTHDADFEPFVPMLLEAEQQGLLKVIAVPGDAWEQIDFGITPTAGYRRPDFFGDMRVRQAIALCIDRYALVDEVTYGRGVVLDSYLPPAHPLYAGSRLAPWDYNPAAGQALLEEAGWLDEDEDSVREASKIPGIRDGTRFEITLLSPSGNVGSQQVARIVRANLADCGIRAEIEALPAWRFYADGPEGPFFGRMFDMAQTTRQYADSPSCQHYVSSEIPDKGNWGGNNASGYSNPEYDAVCQAALRALPGTLDYEEYHKLAQIIFSDELPAMPLFMWLRVTVTRAGVLNVTLDPTSPSELWNVENFDTE